MSLLDRNFAERRAIERETQLYIVARFKGWDPRNLTIDQEARIRTLLIMLEAVPKE